MSHAYKYLSLVLSAYGYQEGIRHLVSRMAKLRREDSSRWRAIMDSENVLDVLSVVASPAVYYRVDRILNDLEAMRSEDAIRAGRIILRHLPGTSAFEEAISAALEAAGKHPDPDSLYGDMDVDQEGLHLSGSWNKWPFGRSAKARKAASDAFWGCVLREAGF